MALEQIVECPVALAKLRSDPLGTLLEGFCKWLLECGFQRESLRRHLSILSRLNEYLRRPKTRMRQTLTAEDIKRFLEGRRQEEDRHPHILPQSAVRKGGDAGIGGPRLPGKEDKTAFLVAT